MTSRTTEEMQDTDWMSLESSVAQGHCILMVGPDAVSGKLDGELLPLRLALGRFVKGRLGPEYADLDETNPAAVAEAAIAKEDPLVLQTWVKNFYDGFEMEAPALRDLANVPFRLVINTLPGPGVDIAFAEVKPETVVDFYDRTGPTHMNLPDPTPNSPLVYNLYGSLEQPSSLILSDKDRLRFLVSVISENPPLPKKLTSALRDPSSTFLFIGFQLQQWQLRLLLHVLADDSTRVNKSFAFELTQSELDSATTSFYKSGHKIHFFDMDVNVFAAELRQRVPQEAATTTTHQRTEAPVSPDAPVVFICHASEDHDFAMQLADDLRENDIGVWLDKDDGLIGGQRWDPAIERALEKEVKYVAILQSKDLKNKRQGESYVNKEINLALERQNRFGPEKIFLIPLIVDDRTSKLAELDDYQSIDLSSDRGTKKDGLNELVRAIKRDVEHQAREL